VLKTKIDELLKTGRDGANAASSRIRTRLAGRSRQVIAVAALTGVASLGLVAAALEDTPNTSDAAATAERQRAEAAFQANRSTRESQTPAATESATPTATATDTPSTATETPAAQAATPEAAPKAAPAWVDPMPAGDISSCYGPRWGTMHAGVDLFTDENEPIQSVGKGTVVAAGWAYSGYGISVVVDHHNGFLTHYAHMNKTAVSIGDEVGAGTLIGYEGSTGDSTGPHLHFEVHAGMWNQIEPAQWLRDRGVDLGGC
jgi:murein DD-endopeptidase MepM/ murein hydrolase activator NlpD